MPVLVLGLRRFAPPHLRAKPGGGDAAAKGEVLTGWHEQRFLFSRARGRGDATKRL